jgi:hypothetical protein
MNRVATHLSVGVYDIKKTNPLSRVWKRGWILNPLGRRLLLEVVEARQAIVAGGGAQLLC